MGMTFTRVTKSLACPLCLNVPDKMFAHNLACCCLVPGCLLCHQLFLSVARGAGASHVQWGLLIAESVIADRSKQCRVPGACQNCCECPGQASHASSSTGSRCLVLDVAWNRRQCVAAGSLSGNTAWILFACLMCRSALPRVRENWVSFEECSLAFFLLPVLLIQLLLVELFLHTLLL